MDKKTKSTTSISESKGIIISTINPIMQNNEEYYDKDYFRGGTHMARVYKVRDSYKHCDKSLKN
jgi:hypothetical protein